jgi:hypothetical protein
MRLTTEEKILVQHLVQYDIWHYKEALAKAKENLQFCTIENEQKILDIIMEYGKEIRIRKVIYDKIQKDFDKITKKGEIK